MIKGYKLIYMLQRKLLQKYSYLICKSFQQHSIHPFQRIVDKNIAKLVSLSLFN